MKYRTLVVDPPWPYRDRSVNGAAEKQYVTTPMDEIASIPVGDWADAEAHLYIWTTNAFMVEAHDLAKAWGFEQKTILTWVKPRLGLGRYYRNTTEHVLFCVRGKLPVLRKDVRTHFIARSGRHSAKPPAFYDMVETMSPGPYLDVFNRNQRLGWDAWGFEAYTPAGLPEPDRPAHNAKPQGPTQIGLC